MLALFHGVDEVLGVGERELDLGQPGVEVALDGPSRTAEHAQHRRVVGQSFGGEAVDPVRAGDRGEVLQQDGRDSAALVGAVDHERDLGVVAGHPALIAGPGDELAPVLDNRGHPVVEVDVGEVVQFFVGEGRLRRQEPAVLVVARLALVEGAQCAARRWP